MTPTPGGAAAKSGERYEEHWTVHWLLEVLAQKAESIQVELIGEASDSIEFEVVRRARRIGHQVKRQHGLDANWTPRRLESEGVLVGALENWRAGRSFVFVSTIPARELDELTSLARSTDSAPEFAAALKKRDQKLSDDFEWLRGSWAVSGEDAWEILGNFYIETPSEDQLRRSNDTIAGFLIDPSAGAAEVLAGIAKDNLGRRLAATQIWSELRDRSFGPVVEQNVQDARSAIADATRRWRSSQARTIEPVMKREVASTIADAAREAKIVLVTGEAGAGKSVALAQAIDELEVDSPVLALRLDRASVVQTTAQLGDQQDLPDSPTIALAQLAQGEPAVLVIDQLDAVSLTSGRLGELFSVVEDLIEEAASFPELHLVFAVRRFDLQSDERFRRLAERADATRVDVPGLSVEEVKAALVSMKISPESLTSEQREVLTNPLALVLLQAIHDDDELDFASLTQLFDRYWTRKQRDADRRKAGVRFEAVIGRVADTMSLSQQLEVSARILDGEDLGLDAEVLVSENVLVRDGDKLSFFHEAFFDYAFARGWLASQVSVRKFLLRGQQELFRRAQVRQILHYLRQVDRDLFAAQVRELLEANDVRYHVKDVVIAVLRTLAEPTRAEWELVREQIATDPTWVEQLQLALRTPGWFDRLHEEGVLGTWLASPTDAPRAVEILGGVVQARPGQVAEILSSVRGAGDYPAWFRWVARWAPFASSRDLFELLLSSVRQQVWQGSEDEFWSITYSFPEENPAWAVELLAVWLKLWRAENETDQFGRLAVLESDDHGLRELIEKTARHKPEDFLKTVLPWVVDLIDEAASEDRLPAINPHLSAPSRGDEIYEVGDALIQGLEISLILLAGQSTTDVKPHLETLALSPSMVSQHVLYKGLAALPELADWTAEILLEGEHRFYDGDYSAWGARELLEVVASSMDQDHFRRLEGAIMAFDPADERRSDYRRWRGMGRLTLLQAMPQERLSTDARRERQELERKIGQVAEPLGIQGGWVRSPIPDEKTKLMSDAQWLSAIREYETDEDRAEFLKGGAAQLSHVLEERAKEAPARFSRLGLQLTAADNDLYLGAILRALGSSEMEVPSEDVFALVRHAAAMESTELDRWLGSPLRGSRAREVTDDVIALLIERAARSTDPTNDRNGDLDLMMVGLNSSRGSLASTFADLIAANPSSERRELIRPATVALVSDSSRAVRAMAARLLHTYVATEPKFVLEQLPHLLEDEVMATKSFESLIGGLTINHARAAKPVVERMLDGLDEVRRAGGRLAAWLSATDAGDELLRAVMSGKDKAARAGAAEVLAARLPAMADRDQAVDDLHALLRDEDEEVRAAAARFPLALRHEALRPWHQLIEAAVESPALDALIAQLLITLEQAEDDVGELILLVAERFVVESGRAMADISTHAAAHAHTLGELILRAARESHDAETTARILDVIDTFLEVGSYGFAAVLEGGER